MLWLFLYPFGVVVNQLIYILERLIQLTKKNEKKNEKLANDIAQLMLKNDVALDTRIYFNNKCIKDGIEIVENIKGSTYFEYANDETVSMSFEGAMYHIINHGTNKKIMEKFDKMFEKHGFYYQLGYAWSLSAYPMGS